MDFITAMKDILLHFFKNEEYYTFQVLPYTLAEYINVISPHKAMCLIWIQENIDFTESCHSKNHEEIDFKLNKKIFERTSAFNQGTYKTIYKNFDMFCKEFNKIYENCLVYNAKIVNGQH